MTARPLAVLRPEPGNTATAGRVAAMGLDALRLPLFRVVARDWRVRDPGGFDALLLTSANAVRHAGPGLAMLVALPVWAVGAATANAARGAGLRVRLAGTGGAAALLAEAAAAGISRALHLSGEDVTALDEAAARIVAERVTVYASEAVAVPAAKVRALAGTVALIHSARAARRLALLVDSAGIGREAVRLAAIGRTAATAAGDGWARVTVADRPDEATLLAAAAALAR